MNDLFPVLICAILVFGVYRLFELFVRRKERMAIIDKILSQPIDSSLLNKQFTLPLFHKPGTSWPIRIGLLLLGIGIGVTIASIVDLNMMINGERDWHTVKAISSLYFACIATFGGLGLVVAYIVEKKFEKKEKTDE